MASGPKMPDLLPYGIGIDHADTGRTKHFSRAISVEYTPGLLGHVIFRYRRHLISSASADVPLAVMEFRLLVIGDW